MQGSVIGLKAKLGLETDDRQIERETKSLKDKINEAAEAEMSADVDTLKGDIKRAISEATQESKWLPDMGEFKVEGFEEEEVGRLREQMAALGKEMPRDPQMGGPDDGSDGILGDIFGGMKGAGGRFLKVGLAGAVGLGILAKLTSLSDAAPRMRKTLSMLQRAVMLFARPLFDWLAIWGEDGVKAWLDVAVAFNQDYQDRGLLVAFADLPGRIAGRGDPGDLEESGRMHGAALGLVAGAGAGAFLGPGGMIAGGILGGAAGFLGGDFLGGKIGAALDDVDWDKWIDRLEWATWISPLKWVHWIADFSWDMWSEKMDWDDWVDALEWASWISPLRWFAYISELSWDFWIEEAEWNEWINDVDWNEWIDDISWGRFVTVFRWARWISPLGWGSYLTSLDWWRYVSNLNWNRWIDGLDWDRWIPELNWRNFIDDLSVGTGSLDPRAHMAEGGLVTRPTRALIGEAGPEIVAPFSEFMQQMNERDRRVLREAAALQGGGGGGEEMRAVLDELKRIRRELAKLDPDVELKVRERALAEAAQTSSARYRRNRLVTK